MKSSKNILLAFVLLILVAAFYRLIPNRPAGFAPQMALALFGGAIIKNKKWAIALPIFSLFLSDLLFQFLFSAGMTSTQGFYEGQWQIYICFMLLTVFGFLMKKVNVKSILGFSISGSMLFFIVTNFLVWAGGGGFVRPKTFSGLVQCYGDAIAFYRDGGLIHGFAANFLLGDLFFTGLLFGSYFLIRDLNKKPGMA